MGKFINIGWLKLFFLFVLFVFGWLIVQALITLPRGPVESTQQWYANARIGVYILTLILWGQGTRGGPTIHYFISRLKEKSAPYSMTVWQWACENLIDWQGVKDMHFWSDGGRHFRASVPIATMTARGCEYMCRRSEQASHCHEMKLSFGVPSHFKNHCDGAQAAIKSLLREVTKEATVSDTDTMIRLIQEKYEQYSADGGRKKRMPAFFTAGSRSNLARSSSKIFA